MIYVEILGFPDVDLGAVFAQDENGQKALDHAEGTLNSKAGSEFPGGEIWLMWISFGI